MSSTTLRVAAHSQIHAVARVRTLGAWPIVLPSALLVGGALVGYPCSLDQRVALERLLGLIVASLLALAATLALRQTDRPASLLVSASVVALLGGVWVISASGPDVFRGTVGAILDTLFRPVFGLAKLTDPVEISNTRFIVGYNGLADLCLVAIFGCGAVVWTGARRPVTVGLVAVISVSLVLLVGTGARGGLTGLAAGICAAGLFAWPRRYAVLALLMAPAGLVLATIGVLDKGLEFSSTAGRITYWGDLARLLVEYPLTGVGLGVDTANRVALQYEINPDPERVFYAHDTFVQSYLEQGPLGALGMLVLPVLAIAAALIARRGGIVDSRRALLIAGLGLVGGLEAHGLTDQVVTTNVGTLLLFLGFSAVLASLSSDGLALLSAWSRRVGLALAIAATAVVVGVLVLPSGRAQALLDLGGLRMNAAFALPAQSAGRAAALGDAEGLLVTALGQDSGHPAVLRDLAAVRSARFDDTGGLQALKQAAESPRLDAFDMLQIAHVYRDLGFADEAYTWAARAYEMWGRAPEDAVMQAYAQSTLSDTRARILATQAEAAMRARTFGEAHSLFEQALTFEPNSAYLHDRLGASQRAVDKYGG